MGIRRGLAESAWCLTARKPLFLRPEAPRLSGRMGLRRGRRGAPSPANPYSFVRKHHALSPNCSTGGTGVVLHHPQTLVPSSGSTTPSDPQAQTLLRLAEPHSFICPKVLRSPYSFISQGPAEPLQLPPPPPPKTGQVPAAGLPQTQPAQFMEMKKDFG